MMRWIVRSWTEYVSVTACSLKRSGCRRHGDLHGLALQHLLVEGVEGRKRLAPAAIGEAIIGIAEHADEVDGDDVERPRHQVALRGEAGHAGPDPVPMIVRPSLPAQRLGPHRVLVAA